MIFADQKSEQATNDVPRSFKIEDWYVTSQNLLDVM